MLLRPFARWVPDRIYRVTYFAVCARRQDFLPTFRALLATTTLPKGTQREVVGHVTASLDGCTGRCFRLPLTRPAKGEYPLVVIWLLPGEDITVAMHEAWHAVHWVFDRRGADLHGADEPVAYYLQWLVRWMLGLQKYG